MDEKEIKKEYFDLIIKDLIIQELVTYDPETDSIIITKKGLKELVSDKVIN